MKLTVDFIYLVSYSITGNNSKLYDYLVKSVNINYVSSPLEVRLQGVNNISLPIEIGQE